MLWKKSRAPRSAAEPQPGHHERWVCICDTRLLARQECIHLDEARAPSEGDQAVETKEQGRAAVNGQVKPLALRFDPQVGPALLESRFQTPAFHERPHDFLRRQRLVRRK